MTITITTTQLVHEKVATEILKIQNELKSDEEQLKIDHQNLEEEKQISKPIDDTNVF
jgi:hypothetical protein